MVAEAGDQFEPSAECLDVAGDGVDSGDFAALDLGYRPGVMPMASASWAWVRPWRLRSSASRYPLWRAMSTLRRCSAFSAPPALSM